RQAHGFHVDDIVLILEGSFDEQEAAAGDGDHVAFVEVGRDDYVGDAGLVFHGNKDETLGCTRALTSDYASGGTDPLAVTMMVELFGGEDSLAAKSGSAVGHGVLPRGKSGAGVVGD